jgi:hypothetical protein
MTKKHYRDLTIDEPLPEDAEARAHVQALTPEQLQAQIEASWFMNPGGHFRRRILKMLERAGVMKMVVLDGQEQMKFADVDDPAIPPELQQGMKHVIDLIKAVDGHLDDAYDPDRTRADYQR